MVSGAIAPLLWFVAIVALIPLALWLLKRTPMGGATSQGILRCVAALPLSNNQRIVTLEIGHGEARRWLVLGVTPGSITTLHTMEPQGDVPGAVTPPMAAGFGQMLARLRQDKGSPGER